jgi:hypothetical protein
MSRLLRASFLSTLFFSLLLIPYAGLEAAKGKPPSAVEPAKPGNVKVTSVVDRRRNDGFFNRLEVVLELSDLKAADVAAARAVAKVAVDDTGKSLVNEKEEASFESAGGGFFGGGAEAAATTRLSLKNPARKASALREVSGEVEVLIPSRDPTSVAVIDGFLAKSGTFLAHPSLKANQVELAVVTREQWEDEKKRAAERKGQEAKKQGLVGEMLDGIVEAFTSAFATPDEDAVILKVKDPLSRIHEMKLVDGGEAKPTMRQGRDEYVFLSAFGVEPGPQTGLRVFLKTPKSFQKIAFRLTDLALP